MIPPPPRSTLFPYTTLFRSELYKLLQDKARKDKEWYFATELDAEGRLQRIFWMSPSQRSLYRRYRDVVLSDNTFKTNRDRKSTRLNSSHVEISYAVFCLKKK